MFKTFICYATLAACIVTLAAFVPGANTYAGTSPPRSVHIKFAPVEMPKGAGPVSLDLAFMPRNLKTGPETGVCACREVEVRVVTIDNLQYFGDTIWTVKVERSLVQHDH